MAHLRLPLIFDRQPEGGFTVTSPLLQELITEGDAFEGAMENLADALAAVIEIDQETGRTFPDGLTISESTAQQRAEMVVAVPSGIARSSRS